MDALTHLTAGIVSAYVGNNAVPAGQLPELIASIDRSVRALSTPAPKLEERRPAVDPKRSIFPDFLICLDDGKRFKSLKRHLRTDHGLTPDAYRARWNLPANYPMVAPNYSAKRSAIAKTAALGLRTDRRAA